MLGYFTRGIIPLLSASNTAVSSLLGAFLKQNEITTYNILDVSFKLNLVKISKTASFKDKCFNKSY